MPQPRGTHARRARPLDLGNPTATITLRALSKLTPSRYFASMLSTQNAITSLGEEIRALKANKASKDQIDPLVAKLKSLKVQLKEENAEDGDETPGKGGFILKNPKGTRDFGPLQMAVREKVFDTITKVFKRHGAVTIDTPVFERKEVLTGKYGEDSKLIYDLENQGGELLSLRYDLTVPFSRYLAMNKISSMKRYHISKVYRRDQPALNRGRFREFYQCDFDIAGHYEKMVPDAECISILTEVLRDLDFSGFVVKANHRKILDGIFRASGVPIEKTRFVSSAVDKLDKTDWSDVRNEIILKLTPDFDQGLLANADSNALTARVAARKAQGEDLSAYERIADRIGDFVALSAVGLPASRALLAQLREMTSTGGLSEKDILLEEGLDEMELFFKYLDIFGCAGLVCFDLSLARGLDYYTGVIYEAILEKPAPVTTRSPVPSAELGVGTFAAGGRYDDLVGMFDPRGQKVPCVGISLGIERILTVMEARLSTQSQDASSLVRQTATRVYVASGQKLIEERMALASELWAAGLETEFSYKRNPKLLDQIQYCETNRIPYIAILGASELDTNTVTLKHTESRSQQTVPRAELPSTLKQLLSA